MDQPRPRTAPACLLVMAGLTLSHVVGTAVVGTYLCASAVDDLGLVRGGQIGFGDPADQDFLTVALLPTVPLVLVEAAGAVWRRRWVLVLAALAASAAAVVDGWFASLLVGLRFWGDTTPVSRSDISDAIATGAVIVVLHLAILVASVAVLRQVKRIRRAG